MTYHPKHSPQALKKISPAQQVIRVLSRLIITVIILIAIAYPFFIEPHWVKVEYSSVVCPDLPADVNRLRVVYLSDIHEGTSWSAKDVDGLVRRVNSLNPDLLLLGGDYAISSESAISFFEHCPSFSARYSVYAVLGDTDRTLPDTNHPILLNAMKNAGVIPLVNAVEPVRIGSGSTIYVAGIDDVINGKPDMASVAGSVRTNDFVILLCHNPSAMNSLLQQSSRDGHRSWFDLGLFGHTHGGQMALFGSTLGLTENVPSSYVSGWTAANKIPILTSNGIGTTGMPIRFLRRPTIHVITVTAR